MTKPKKDNKKDTNKLKTNVSNQAKWWAEHKNDPNVQEWRSESLHRYNTSDKNKANQQRYKKRNPILFKINQNERARRYYNKNKKKISEKSKDDYWNGGKRDYRLQHYQENKDKVSQQNKNWRDTHKEEKLLLGQNRRALQYKAKGTHTIQEWNELKKLIGNMWPWLWEKEHQTHKRPHNSTIKGRYKRHYKYPTTMPLMQLCKA